jgi:hypothetical protein
MTASAHYVIFTNQLLMTRDSAQSSTPREVDSNQTYVKEALALIAIILGLILCVAGDSYQGDAVSYLDMGDHFFSGDWNAIVNGLWSPLFPFLHGLTRFLLKPSMVREPLVVQLTNWMIFIAALLSFQFYWGELLGFYDDLSCRVGETTCSTLSSREFWFLGYATFSLLHVRLVTFTNPDTLLSAVVYLAAGLIIRIKLRGPTLWRFLLFGLILGLGFLAKAVMLPLTGVFLGAAVLPNLRQRLVLPYAAVSILVFSLVAGPYVFELSKKEGHFTTGEAGALNYAWHVNQAPFAHWQGESPDLGRPVHATREILSSPRIYEFATPFTVTYPPWYDPSYWNRGLTPRFDLAEELVAFEATLKELLKEIWYQGVLATGVLILLAMREAPRRMLKEYLSVWYLWAPSFAAFMIYSLLWIEGRYLSQFFLMMWGSILMLVRLPRGIENRRFIRTVVVVVVVLIGIKLAGSVVKDGIQGHDAAKLQMQIARDLAARGIRPGERAAVVGGTLGDGWAKLAQIYVIAEVVDRDKFWTSDSAQQKEICQLLARTGATIMLAEMPEWNSGPVGWERVGATDVWLFHLQ